MPELFLKLNELIEAGKKNSATELQYGINEIISKMCSARANMYAVAKEILYKGTDSLLFMYNVTFKKIARQHNKQAKEP